jgi:hypothetical protein
LNQTTLFVVGSIVIAVFVLALALPFILPRENRVPETYPAEIEIGQSIVCTSYSTMKTKYYDYSVPSAYTLYVSIYAKSYTRDILQIDKIIPYKQPNNTLNLNILLKPGEVYMDKLKAPWGPVTQLSTYAYPGDVIQIKNMEFVVAPGTVYSSTAPVQNQGQVPSSFKCPFSGNTKYKLNMDGEKISATIKNPGCAGVVLTNVPYLSKYLLVSDYKVGDYYYEDKDVPFFLSLYQRQNSKAGIYRKAGSVGVLYNTHTSEVSTSNDDYQAGILWVDGSHANLYIDKSKNPVIANKYTSAHSGMLVLGLAREKPAKTSPIIKICAYERSGSYHCISYDPGTLKYKIVKNGKIIKQGKVPVLSYGDEISDALRNNGIIIYYNPHPGSSHVAMLRYRGSPIKFYMQPLSGAKVDTIVAWEDLVGTYPPGDSRIDGNGDEWIHVTYFENGTWRIAGYIASGEYKHVFYMNDQQIFVKDYGKGWSNKVNGIYEEYPASFFPQYYYYPFETAPLSSYVRYVGLFKDKTITIKGLMKDDRVIIKAGDTVKTYVASGDTMVIDLLSEFTPRELVDALENGGILVTVVPSIQHLLYFIPTDAKAHIKTKMHDMWVDVYMPVKTECDSRLFVHSVMSPNSPTYTTVLTTDDYKMWSVTFNGQKLGTYPKVDVIISRGSVKIYSKYGVYTYTAPTQVSAIKITTAPINYIGVQIGSQLVPIPYVYKIVITGKLYQLSFSFGK